MCIVLKFGGSSISKQGFDNIINHIKINKNKNIIIVLSALYQTTNHLLEIIENSNNYQKAFITIIKNHQKLLIELELSSTIIDDLIKELNDNITKYRKYHSNPMIPIILSYGEKLSTLILYKYLQKHNLEIKLINGGDIIKTKNSINDMHNKYYMKGTFYCDDKIIDYMKNYKIIITQGFVGRTIDNHICTLSRGGSDTTAALIATKTKAERLEIWTDVNGIYNADPNIIKNAKIITEIDYELCQEMAGMGAKVLHPYCILPCKKANIPIYIKNTYDENNINTKISNDINNELSIILQKNNKVFEITSLDMWNNYGFVADIFLKFKNYSIDINIITTSQYSVLATTTESDDNKIMMLSEELSKNYEVNIFNCDLISIIGRNILQNKKLPKLFSNLNNHDKILITHFSSNNMCLTFAVTNDISIYMYKRIYNQIFDTENRFYQNYYPFIGKDILKMH